jgi:hypothetical protein
MCTYIGKQQKELSLINNNHCHSLGPQILIANSGYDNYYCNKHCS